ncbi:DUF3300 domain-containing protein [Pseudomonas sp. UFMG81]|jgi:hypothetical protein|uniref:DUF3300 domain-containing protein n=1 Tax=Pseudomonas sp. UFMG81 TaxID=2745936 RepID=UPI00189097EF|nr:DUF3300 domain-containing protein [Pseudomonas sp. UFMG81]
MRTRFSGVLAVLMLLQGAPALAETQAPAAAPATADAAKSTVFSQEQLDQMLAPIALYPDPLLAQVLMASTYPGEVAEAVAWSKANPNAKGDDAVKQVAGQPWDPSVQALVAFPQVLATLGQDPVWVQRLGDAFLAQPDDLMNGVQRLRRQAQAAGNLTSNQYQNVTVQAAPAAPAAQAAPASSGQPSQTIIIQPADPQTVYVPTYNPNTTYGTWAYPASPPVYYPPPPAYYPGQALVAGLAFGTGVAVVASLWGDCDWNDHDVDIDVNRYNNINRNNQITNISNNKWQHNPVHRDGVPYRDARNREQFGRQLAGAPQRVAYRGDDAQRAQARQNALNSMDRHGIERPAANNVQARERVREAQSERGAPGLAQHRQEAPRGNQGGQLNQRRQGEGQARQQLAQRQSAGHARNNAFDGVRSPSRSSAQANRGRTSQAFAQRGNSPRAMGQQVSRPSGFAGRQRGGGRR